MPTEKIETKVEPTDTKKKLLYVTLAVPLIGATIALSFGDPACLQNIGGDETTSVTETATTDTTEVQSTSTSTSTALTSDVTSSTVSTTVPETDATTSV